MLKVEPTSYSSRAATGNDRNSNEAVAGATSEAFTRWHHHRYAPVELLGPPVCG